uniref:tyrosine-type recombinase/integrase n=1 Tax=Escherichia coli TaxID=562 RepID=UPI00201CF5DB
IKSPVLCCGENITFHQVAKFSVPLHEAGKRAGLAVKAHPHMLRHACGFALADNGVDTRLLQDYLGHRNIQHTVRYTASNAARFKGVWKKKPR